jgi:alpha-tubulin suppressor-like RCC1 family protein
MNQIKVMGIILGIICVLWNLLLPTHATTAFTRVRTAGANIALLQAHRYRPVTSRVAPREFMRDQITAVISFGDDTASRDNVNLRTAQFVASGKSHHLAVRDDYAIIGWGSNTQGQLNIPTIFSALNPNRVPVTELSAGDNHNVALSIVSDVDTGEMSTTVYAWGSDNALGQRSIPARVNNANTRVLSIAAGANHTIAYIEETDTDSGAVTGSVICWGNSCTNTVPAALQNIDINNTTVTDILAQGNHNAALLSTVK